MSKFSEKLKDKTTKLNKDMTPIEDHPADLDYYTDGSFYHVPMELINPNPNQPREYFDVGALEELTQSVKQNGVLQPVIITMDVDRKVFLVAGERRFRAAKDAGLEKIPAVFTTGDSAEIAIIENVQREDLNPIEKAKAYKRLMEEHNRTLEEVSTRVGKAKSTVSEILSLNRLPDQIKDEVRRAEQYPRRLLVEVAKQETSEEMISLFNQIKTGNLKSGDVRKITRKRSDKPKKTSPEIMLGMIKGLKKSLNELDIVSIEEPGRRQIVAELCSLKTEIGRVLGY